jgi:hypothetical protein
MMERSRYRWMGLLMGAWLGALYGLVFESINYFLLPEIPLRSSSLGVMGTMLVYMVIGTVLGLVSNWFESRIAGALVSGVICSVLVVALIWSSSASNPMQAAGTLLVTLISIFPLIVLTAPLGFIIRMATDGLVKDPSDPGAKRKIIWLVAGTVIFAGLGLMNMYSSPVQGAFRMTYAYVRAGLAGEDPGPLKTVQNFPGAVIGSYTMEKVDGLETFQGRYSAGLDETTAFQIVVRFENNFSFSCLFGNGITVPPCASYPY